MGSPVKRFPVTADIRQPWASGSATWIPLQGGRDQVLPAENPPKPLPMGLSPAEEGLPLFRAVVAGCSLFLGRRCALLWKLICTLAGYRDKRMPDGDREDPEYG